PSDHNFSSTWQMSSVKVARGNSGSSLCRSPLAPSSTTCTSLRVPGPKPRLVASARAHSAAAWRPANVAYKRLLSGPCSRPARPGAHPPPARSFAFRPLAPLAPPRLAAAGLPPGPAAVPLAAAGTAPRPGPAAAAALGQLRLGRGRRARAVDLDHQHLPVR